MRGLPVDDALSVVKPRAGQLSSSLELRIAVLSFIVVATVKLACRHSSTALVARSRPVSVISLVQILYQHRVADSP